MSDGHRRTVAAGVAVLAIAVAAWLALRPADEDPVVRDEAVAAIVRSAASEGAASTCEVELAGGARVSVACGTPPPKAGETLALRALHRRSGAVTYYSPRATPGL